MDLGRRAGAILGAAVGWGLVEAGWPRLRELELAVPGLPPALDGLRVAHLSDFHLGVPSPGAAAVAKAVDWTAGREPDLTVVTGDLLTHPRGEPLLRSLVERLPQPTVAVLGNHDVAISRDPQAVRSDLADLAPATLLRGAPRTMRARAGGRRPTPTSSRTGMPTSASSSATTHACSTCSSRAASSSCSPVTCTTGRSRFPIPAASFASHI